jgi:hypothetical protein
MLKGHDLFAFKIFNYVRRDKRFLILTRRMNVEMLWKVHDYVVREYEYAFG